MLTISVLSLAGGQGKTTLTLFLSLFLSRLNRRVLTLDADPQRSLTLYLQVDTRADDPTLLEFLRLQVNPPESAVYGVPGEDNLYLIPADRQLKEAGPYLSSLGTGALVLKNRLKAIKDLFDYCIIDAQPSDSQIVMSVAGAADLVLIPVEANAKGVGSLADTLNFLDTQASNLGFEGKVLGVVPFRDKWVGHTQTKESRDAIAAFSELLNGAAFPIFPSLRESEQYKKGIRFRRLLSDLGLPDYDYPFLKIAEHLGESDAQRVLIKSWQQETKLLA